MRTFLKNESGAILVEFALLTPVLFLMLMGIMVWGYSLTLTATMYDAARQGARQLSVGTGTEASVEAAAGAFLAEWPQVFTVVAQDTGTTGTNDVIVTITADNVLGDLFTFVPALSGLSAQVTMRKEAS